jgi:MFS family permease
MIATSQIATAIAGALIVPAVTGMTLGLVRQRGFNRQNGRNQAFNHTGNMVGAGVSGLLGWAFGFSAVFWLAAAFGIVSIISVLLIPASSIDDREARGQTKKDGSDGSDIKGFQILLQCKPLLILAAALALFHLGNGAMLPLYGLAVVAAKQSDPAGFVATTIVVAQATMILASVLAMRMAEKEGYWLVMLITFIALPIRGLVAAFLIEPWGVFPVQILDGVGAGLQSVAVPGLVARLLNGTGRINVGQGAVMAIQGIGASLSPALGGWIAQLLGYPAAFLILGALSLVALAIWVGFGSLLSKACSGTPFTEASPS